MAARDPLRRKQVARIAAEKRHGQQSAEVTDLHRNIKAEALERHIREAVEAAPPLTADQRDKLAVLLRGSAA